MAIVNRTTAKTYFNTGDKPTESQFGDFIDSALFYEDTSDFGRSLVSASSATLARNLLGVGVVGNSIFTAITTASAQQNIGGGIVGRQVFEAITTASAQTALGGGVVGRAIFEAITTASATNIVNQIATITTQGVSYLNNPITIANNATNPNTQMDIGAGIINYDTGGGQLLCQAITKTLQSSGSWTAGTNQNGLDTGARANSTWYQIFEIVKNSDNTSDILYSTSRTSPTIPSGYTLVAWIGAIRTDGSGNIDQSYLAKRTNYGQIVRFQTGAYGSTTGNVPYDDTPPQSGETGELMSLSINPLSASSKLLVNVEPLLYTATTGSAGIVGCIFRDSDANSLASRYSVQGNTGWSTPMNLSVLDKSNSTSATTFKFKVGGAGSLMTIYLNGYGSRIFGGTGASSITIQEYI